MKRSQRPIGVFDSGLGGLTVLRAIRRRLPKENLIYFGDTARVPYGPKSRQAVTRYSLEIARFLARRGIKFLVVACNSASAMALPRVKRAMKIPVLGVIEPGARAALAAAGSGPIGVIGTRATIGSKAYEKALKSKTRGVRVFGRVCPLFVPLVEEGWWDHRVTADVARIYLRPLKARRLGALILGCTHYPMLKGILRRELGPKVRLIDSADETAREVEAAIGRAGLRRTGGRGKTEFFLSDASASFPILARRLLGSANVRATVKRFD